MEEYPSEETEVKVNFYIEHARIQINSLRRDIIIFNQNRKLLTNALDSVERALDVLAPYLALETYSSFANHLGNLARHLDSVNLEKESKLTQKINREFTQKVLSNLFS